MLGVGDSVTYNVLKENLKNTPSLLIDEARDSLDAPPPSKSPDGRLGDTLDVPLTPSYASWHLPCPIPFRLCHVQSSSSSRV